DLCLDRQEERAGQKRLDRPIWRPSTFRKDNQRRAIVQALEGRAYASYRSRFVLLIDTNLPRPLQVPADDRVFQKFLLEHDPELEGQIVIKDRNIKCRRVIH